METAEVSDVHAASGPDVWEEPAEKLDHLKAEGAGTVGARFAQGEGHETVLEADETLGGHGHLADGRGEVCEGGGGSRVGLAVDVP